MLANVEYQPEVKSASQLEFEGAEFIQNLTKRLYIVNFALSAEFILTMKRKCQLWHALYKNFNHGNSVASTFPDTFCEVGS